MFMSLNAPAIGIRGLALPALIDLAARAGFGGLDLDMGQVLAHLGDSGQAAGALRRQMADRGLRPGAWSLPVEGAQDEWAVDLDRLRAQAEAAAELGAWRVATWVPSWSDRRDMPANIAFHVARLSPVAKVLAEYGMVLGLEFLGPLTLQQGHAHPFLRSMGEMLALARQIGPGQVGLLVDAWHLHASGGTLAELARLAATEVVHVHISDAPLGVARDQLVDNRRKLPLETGVIDLAGFLRGLAVIGYQGPVATEPFNAGLNGLAASDPFAAAHLVHQAMARAWRAAGLD